MIPACSDDTVEKLRDLHPEKSLNLNLENLPTPESLNAFWDGEEGTALRNKLFSVTKVRKHFRNCQALGATDIDGWRGREHILYLLANNDTELHQLIIDELIFPYVMGKFLPLFLPELAGGLLFAFLKKDGGLRPLLCGSIWRRCAAGSQAIVRETRPTHISPPHIQILCNAQVAYRMVPRDTHRCLTCSMICPRMTR